MVVHDHHDPLHGRRRRVARRDLLGRAAQRCVLVRRCADPAGSIYIWASESGGRRYGRFFGFIVALWTTTAWTSFVASLALATTNFMLRCALRARPV